MRPARDAIHELVKLGLAPMFKRHGFTKTALNFARRRGSVAHYLNVQLSQWNQGSNGQFYLNAGVMFDDLRRLRGQEPPHIPKYGDCDFMVRLERLNPELPKSVVVDESTDVTALARWLSERVETTFVMPLNSVASIQDFDATGWVNAVPWDFPAVFQYTLGNIPEARRLVQIQADTFADRGCTFESIAKSLNINFAHEPRMSPDSSSSGRESE